MNFNKFSRWERTAIIIVLAVFIFSCFLVLFQRDKLDSLFRGTSSETESLLPSNDYMADSFVYLNIFSEEAGEASVFLDTQSDYSITGVELSLSKDSSFEISDFVCSEPFECIFFETSEEEVSLAAVIPAGVVQPASTTRLLVGNFYYEGSGNLYLTPGSESFVSDVDDPEYNILKLDNFEFSIK